MVVLVDKMLKTQIVECSAVANYIFSKEIGSEFTKNYLWEILHLTIKKVCNFFCLHSILFIYYYFFWEFKSIHCFEVEVIDNNYKKFVIIRFIIIDEQTRH